jgi:hypothetical protein
MLGKIIPSFIIVFLGLIALKGGVDACLPYRSSAIFPMLANREIGVCRFLADWDELARIKRTQIFEVLTIPMSQMEKDAINPSTFGWGDLFLFWRVPLILPLVLEQVPGQVNSNIKLLCFAFSLTIFTGLVFYYMALVYKAVVALIRPPSSQHTLSPETQRLTSLMGRSNSSNNVFVSKKRD